MAEEGEQPPAEPENNDGLDGAAADAVEKLAETFGVSVDVDGDGDTGGGGGGGGGDDETGSNDGSIGSIIMWVCISPWFMLLAVMLIGWNEKRAVCAVKALEAGLDTAKDGSCSDVASTEGELAFMNCALAPAPAPAISAAATGTWSAVKHAGYCMETTYEMNQCEEVAEQTTTGTGNNKKTTTTYTHRLTWASHWIDSSAFKGKAQDSWKTTCKSTENPSWPSDFANGVQRTYNEVDAKAGSWTVTKADLMDAGLSCTGVVPTTLPAISGYTQSGGVYSSSSPKDPAVGAKRVTIKGDDAAGTMIMGVGKNSNGRLQAWKSPGTWLCPGYDVYAFKSGTITKEQYFADAKSAQGFLTWFLRLFFFCILWCAWYCLGKPFVDMLDVIPCVGDMLEDFMEGILPIITCPPACACCCFVAGIVWIAMRPLVAIPLLLMCCCLCGLTIFTAMKSKENKAKKDAKLKGGAGGAPPGETE
eukprot:TRINITY_DN16985_c0_g1_i1.p1 TRINITY_DN16985_c0_g1~~TRINITY_DN16985_c0_g1_i1.p1  ORF type:complete len:475 (-),score=109.78 TRINITY_DN16985_c0_g1_i1:396-1820(-)